MITTTKEPSAGKPELKEYRYQALAKQLIKSISPTF